MTPLVSILSTLTAVAGVFWLFWTPTSLKAPEKLTGRVSYVVDGDSLYLDGHKPQIRLWGVDAPEKGRTGFKAATDYLFLIAQSEKITCQKIDIDKYGRTVARCFLSDGREINRMMIASKKAREYLHFTSGFYSE